LVRRPAGWFGGKRSIVDLELTSDQELLRATTARFVESSSPLAVRRFAEDGVVDREYVRTGGELGWFAMLVPEEIGGGSSSGRGVFDAAVLAEERGKSLQPGPFIAQNVVAAALAIAGTGEQRGVVLPALVAGEQVAAWADPVERSKGSCASGVSLLRGSSGLVLSGSASAVESMDVADWVLVSARDDGGHVALVLVSAKAPGLRRRELEGLDITRRFFELSFDDVRVSPEAIVGDEGRSTGVAERLLDYASILVSAESVGAMDRLFGMTLEYAKVRTAFGRPIGSFQAVKHLLADTSLMLEASAAATGGAARALVAASGSASAAASMAKAFVGESGIELAQNCWQVFGGIAYTWEHDMHLFLRRLTANAELYGGASWHRERVCQAHGL
jgi:alkylation response protein AidB-like acyl-CoA dehydrogenase